MNYKNIKIQKYKIGDILQHNEYESMKLRIVYIFDSFYDETGYSKETYYQIIIDNNDIPPAPIKESSLNKYYRIISTR